MLPHIYKPHKLNQTLNTVHLLVGFIQFIRFDKNLNFFVSDNFIFKKKKVKFKTFMTVTLGGVMLCR